MRHEKPVWISCRALFLDPIGHELLRDCTTWSEEQFAQDLINSALWDGVFREVSNFKLIINGNETVVTYCATEYWFYFEKEYLILGAAGRHLVGTATGAKEW